MRAIQPFAVLVEVLVEVAGFLRGVDEDIGLAHRGPRQVVGAEAGAVALGAPVARQRQADIAELEQLGHQARVRVCRRGIQLACHLGVGGCGLQQ